MCMMKKTVPAAQSGEDNIQDMLPVACDDNIRGKFTTATIKTDYSYEKQTNRQYHFKKL